MSHGTDIWNFVQQLEAVVVGQMLVSGVTIDKIMYLDMGADAWVTLARILPETTHRSGSNLKSLEWSFQGRDVVIFLDARLKPWQVAVECGQYEHYENPDCVSVVELEHPSR